MVCAGRFFEGADEVEEVEEVWPFTSKVCAAQVWAAPVVATIRTANRTELLKTKLLNAEGNIPPARH
jgi:hypothetical protein